MRESNTEVKLYAQEPAFTSLDRDFLALLSIQVCTDDIPTHIAPRTFVFSPFVDWYLLLPLFLKGKNPVLYVGNEILNDYGAYAQSDDKKAKLEECNDLGGKWIEKRDVAKMGDFELHPHALNGMVVYWLTETEETEETEATAESEKEDGGEGMNKKEEREKVEKEDGPEVRTSSSPVESKKT